MPNSTVTKGAMRAAREIYDDMANPESAGMSVDQLAAVIDRETACKELAEMLGKLVDAVNVMDAYLDLSVPVEAGEVVTWPTDPSGLNAAMKDCKAYAEESRAALEKYEKGQ